MIFLTKIKNNQTRYLSKTWYDKLALREIQKNNYRVTGDAKKAKEFASAVTNFEKTEKIVQKQNSPTIIFSKEKLGAISFSPAPVLAT